MWFLKPKRQRELDRELKRCARELMGSDFTTKLMANDSLRAFRLALEQDKGGRAGFMALSLDEKAGYMTSFVERMNTAREQKNVADFTSAYVFAIFLESLSNGYHSTMNKTITVMETLARMPWHEYK